MFLDPELAHGLLGRGPDVVCFKLDYVALFCGAGKAEFTLEVRHKVARTQTRGLLGHPKPGLEDSWFWQQR